MQLAMYVAAKNGQLTLHNSDNNRDCLLQNL